MKTPRPVLHKLFNYTGMLMAWFAVVSQLVLMLENSHDTSMATIIRFFSFFTILTNTWVAFYFTFKAFGAHRFQNSFLLKNGSITAIATFIFIVGFVYQIALRQVWNPEGMQRIVDELLHTVVPMYFVVYWCLFSKAEDYHFKSVLKWLIYPVGYMVYIFIRGAITNEYPYPFIHVPEIGLIKAAFNSLMILAFSIIVMFVLTFIGKQLLLKQST